MINSLCLPPSGMNLAPVEGESRGRVNEIPYKELIQA